MSGYSFDKAEETDSLYIAFAGPIGSGKTTLSQIIAEALGAVFVPEKINPEANPFLERFYAEKSYQRDAEKSGQQTLINQPYPLATWSMATELSFLCQRVDLMRDINALLATGRSVVSDWVPAQNLVFSQLTLTEDEFRLYESLYVRLLDSVRNPDLIVCLEADLDTLIARIKKRGREMETELAADYLKALSRGYGRWKIEPPGPIVWVPTDKLYLETPTDKQRVAKKFMEYLSEFRNGRQRGDLFISHELAI